MEGEPRSFCGLKPEANSVEANFALKGDEETLDAYADTEQIDRRRLEDAKRAGFGLNRRRERRG